MITEHTYRDNPHHRYYKVGSYKVFDADAFKLWELMCGEEKIKDFLSKCVKESPGSKFVVADLKEKVHQEEFDCYRGGQIPAEELDRISYLSYCDIHHKHCRFKRVD